LSTLTDLFIWLYSVEWPGEELPLCTGNLLDKREHRYAKEANGSYDSSRMISKLGSCQLIRYTFEQAVGCFDEFHERNFLAQNLSNNLNLINRPHKTLHLAFIGDSRMRQQFFNFLKVRVIYCLQNFLWNDEKPRTSLIVQISWFQTTIEYRNQVRFLHSIMGTLKLPVPCSNCIYHLNGDLLSPMQ
jgi:hypothetical protein